MLHRLRQEVGAWSVHSPPCHCPHVTNSWSTARDVITVQVWTTVSHIWIGITITSLHFVGISSSCRRFYQNFLYVWVLVGRSVIDNNLSGIPTLNFMRTTNDKNYARDSGAKGHYKNFLPKNFPAVILIYSAISLLRKKQIWWAVFVISAMLLSIKLLNLTP